MKSYLRVIVATSMVFSVTVAQAYECKPTSASACSGGECATNVGSEMTIYFSEDEKTVSRCDKKGCSPVSVQVANSGVMLKAASAYNGYLLVIDKRDLSFTEVATSMTLVFVKSGSCVQ
jgi:hypothetical protein